KADGFAILVRAGEVGIGIAKDAAFLLLGKGAEDAGSGFAASGQVMVVQAAGVAPVGDRVAVRREGAAGGEQDRSQGPHPAGQELLLVQALGALRVVGREAL